MVYIHLLTLTSFRHKVVVLWQSLKLWFYGADDHIDIYLNGSPGYRSAFLFILIFLHWLEIPFKKITIISYWFRERSFCCIFPRTTTGSKCLFFLILYIIKGVCRVILQLRTKYQQKWYCSLHGICSYFLNDWTTCL